MIQSSPTLMDRLDHLTSIPPEYRTEAPPAPPSVKIELTARCNYACEFCATRSKLRTKGDMEFNEFVRIATELKACGVKELGLFYLGESFLVPWLPDAIEQAKRHIGFDYVFLTTNGSLATPDRVDACMAAGLDSLKFSLNWADAEQFENVAGVKPSLFMKATVNILEARRVRDACGYACKLYGSHIAYDGDQAARMAAYLAHVSPALDHVYTLPLFSQGGHLDTDDNAEWKFSVGNRGRAECMRPPVPCWALFTEGHISWDSKLSACCFDHDYRFEMGDLKAMNFMGAWHSEKFIKLRRAHLDGDVSGTVCNSCING